jgi:transposase-like protein
MTSKTTNKFSPEVRARAVRMVLDHASEHPSRWTAVTSIAGKIGCTPQTLHDWVKKAEIDSGPAFRPRWPTS